MTLNVIHLLFCDLSYCIIIYLFFYWSIIFSLWFFYDFCIYSGFFADFMGYICPLSTCVLPFTLLVKSFVEDKFYLYIFVSWNTNIWKKKFFSNIMKYHKLSLKVFTLLIFFFTSLTHLHFTFGSDMKNDLSFST